MGLIADQEKLTVLDPAFEQKRRSTYPGMAHFAGSGPARKTCRECVSWTGCGGERGYYAKKGNYAGQIKPRSCAKYKDLMQGATGPGIPHDAAACKFFEENQSPPPIASR